MIKHKKIVLLILELGLIALISAALLAPTAVNIPRYVIAGGGSGIQGTNYSVIGTTGQNVVGNHGSSASFSACSGFWCGGLPPFVVFLPIILRN